MRGLGGSGLPRLTRTGIATLVVLGAAVAFGVAVALFSICSAPGPEQVDERWTRLGVAEPEIVFLGEFSEEEQVALLREVQAAQVLFHQRFDIVTSDFTIYLSSRFINLQAAFTRLYPGSQLGWFPCGGFTTAKAAEAAVFVLIENCSGWGRTHGDVLAHEYFHILQIASGATFSGGYDISDAWKIWLIEGSADYAMALHSEARGRTTVEERRFGARYGWSDIARPLPGGASSVETYTWELTYQVGFLAVDWLVERAGEGSILEFFRLGGHKAAFEAAFGMTFDEFHVAFEEHRLEVAPPFE